MIFRFDIILSSDKQNNTMNYRGFVNTDFCSISNIELYYFQIDRSRIYL